MESTCHLSFRNAALPEELGVYYDMFVQRMVIVLGAQWMSDDVLQKHGLEFKCCASYSEVPPAPPDHLLFFLNFSVIENQYSW